ncbi:MAG: S41 family peptidase [Phycisphaerales bacterium]
MNPRQFRFALVAILAVVVVGSTLAVTRTPYSFFDPLIEVQSVISRRYVEGPDEQAMQAGAISGMLEALKDPYTVYVPAAETREFTKELTGDYVGIGVQVVQKDGWLTVVAPLEDSPAFRAGVLSDDRIVEIDGKPTLGLASDTCIQMLSGEAGAAVAIVVERDGKRVPFTIVRERVIARTVKGFHRINGGGGGGDGKNSWQYFIDPARRIAYIRLTQFTPTSAEEFKEAMASIGAEKDAVGALILDLRWNPGGVLQDAVQIADLFLGQGVIVSTRGRAKPEETTRATAEGTLPAFPIAVLINGSSASASEILAGAIVENDRGVAVGTRTFGKGLVQAVVSLPSGAGQLKFTEQRYYLPSGRSINRDESSAEWGVDPSGGFYVPMTDEQTTAMLKVRREEDAVRTARAAADEKWSDPEWIVERLKDLQLAAALKAVQGRLASGKWEPTGEALPKGSDLASKDLERASRLRERMEKELVKLEKRIEDLQAAAGEPAKPADLWADADLTGGLVEVRDQSGKVVARLRITGPDVERWLIEADVKKDDGKK